MLVFTKEIKMNKQSIEDPNLPETEFLTRRESAQFLRLSLSGFDKLKDITRVKYGKSVRFSIRSLREYANAHTIGGKKDD
jgi:hypothetical protein